MNPQDNPYARLGIESNASAEELHQAFAAAARRFHPDHNSSPEAAEEYARVSRAHDVLKDPARRAAHDMEWLRRGGRGPWARLRVTLSRRLLPACSEPQVVYALVEIRPDDAAGAETVSPPLNLCLVIDRSTSMQGARLDQVKASAQEIVGRLRPQDSISVVAFSDRAEVVVPAQPGGQSAVARAKVSTIRAGGGTEMSQGLALGLAELRQELNPERALNHLTVLTDGRTYGDEGECLALARAAADDGIRIDCLGIGEEWNDSFLDELAGCTGARAIYLASPQAIARYFDARARSFQDVCAQHLLLRVVEDPGIRLQSVFKLFPEPHPFPEATRLRLGTLSAGEPMGLLMQLLVPPQADGETAGLVRLALSGSALTGDADVAEELVVDASLPVRADAPRESAPLAIVEAMGKLTLYRLQEKSRADVERGDIASATRRLRSLATHLAAAGEMPLARHALAEAQALDRTRQLSAAGAKRLKYGTRALLSPGEDPP